MTWYFAYGMNMDPVHMAWLCPGMEPLGTARLDGFRFAINRRGLATILKDPAAAVHGVVWILTEAFEKILDGFEGVDEGMYWREFVPLTLPSGVCRQALVYIATDRAPGVPRVPYLDQIIGGGHHFGLPAGYLAELKGWSPRGRMV